MKKICSIFLCLFIGLSIGIPIFYNSNNKLDAAAPAYLRETIIDFDVFYTDNSSSSVYEITKDRIVLFFEIFNADFANNYRMITDENGKPIRKVKQVSGSTSRDIRERSEPNGIALREDGLLYVWGDNRYGQFGNGTTSTEYQSNAIVVDSGIPDIVSVLSTTTANYVVTADGDVYASGDNSHGQLGREDVESSTGFVRVNIQNVKKLVATNEPSTVYALTKDGRIYSWGQVAGDGIVRAVDAKTPIQLYMDNQKDYFTNAVDIDVQPIYAKAYDTVSLDILTYDGHEATTYYWGSRKKGGVMTVNIHTTHESQVQPTDVFATDQQFTDIVYLVDGALYVNRLNGVAQLNTMYNDKEIERSFLYYVYSEVPLPKIKKMEPDYTGSLRGLVLLENGLMLWNGYTIDTLLPLKALAEKNVDNSSYESEERYNDDVTLYAIVPGGQAVTCKVQDPAGTVEKNCDDFTSNQINVTASNNRIYRKYIFESQGNTTDFTVDLYKEKPKLTGYSDQLTNRIKITDTINISVPTDQAAWNSYTAKITDSAGTTKDYTGGTLAEGSYTLKVTDAYGNTQDYRFEVVDKPTPTADFTPSSTTLTYGDNATKINQTIGKFSLSYPAGEPTSTIKTIQLGTAGDEDHFSIDTSGNLKVKGNDLDAGTYSVTVSGTDGNDMAFTKTVSITVAKKDQNNYQITNSANYPLQVNQEIAITTSGNESGGSETYSITNGNTVAQISNGNKFKILDSGTFTLEATVAGNTNYNSKTVTKQITISQLPTQNPPVSITSKDSMMYGDTYTHSYSGGQGSGAISWKIESDNGTGAVLNNGSIKVTGIGSFTLKVTKAGTSSYQESSATKVITVNKRKTTVKPKDVTKVVGEAFKPNGATYNPQPISGDNLGTLTITSKYPDNQVPGRYTDGIQASGLSNPNYDFVYQEGTLIVNSNALPNNGEGYYKVTGTKGKNNWYISDVQISTTNKNGYDEISKDGINFQTTALVYSSDGSYPTDFYLRNSSTGIISKAIRYQLKIDQTAPDVPTVTMKEVNKNIVARFINALSFGNWMNQAVQVTMTSSDGTSGIDYYEYTETSQNKPSTKTSTNGIVTYQDDVELTVKAKACDKAGNCSELSNDESVMIDTKAPTISGVKDKSEYKQYYLPRFVNVKDNGSGLSYSEYKKDGVNEGTIQNNVDEKIIGVGEYEVYAIDNAGNEITITFKIVSLPDIETEIDGSDESKEIIDQVIEELEEIKDKIDETEKKDIEDWIKDALEKWESLRKKVVETDDKSAKVEGQGDTDFDPSVVLIVDDITDQAEDIPPLPRKAINVYDVYLQKGNVRIQPDGSIKVYLPYTETKTRAVEETKPIVYEIDETDKVTEINSKKEGNFVTFITDELLRYAISNDKQEINKDDMCVVGPDGKPNTGDEVCGLPSEDGKQPEKKPDGSVQVPDGGKVEFPNGTEIETPDGAIIHPDGSVTLPDGTEYDPNGNKKPGDTCVVGPDGNVNTGDEVCGLPSEDGKQPEKKPDGSVQVPDGGKVEFPNGTEIETPDGAIIHPDGSVTLPDGTEYDPNGNKKPSKQCPLEGKDINVDTDGDGLPDLNLDIDGDCISDLNIDTNFDNIPDINIDTKGDGKPDINIDTDNDGKADLNIAIIKRWIPNKDCNYNGFAYDTGEGFTPILNIDTDGDGKADRNIDTNGDGIPDLNVDSDWQNSNNKNQSVGGANTGDNTKWTWWWILLILTGITMIYSQYKKRKSSRSNHKDTFQ